MRPAFAVTLALAAGLTAACADDHPQTAPLAAANRVAPRADAGNDAGRGPVAFVADAVAGERLYVSVGCNRCHTTTGFRMSGPSFLGIAGSDVELADGTTVLADAAYLEASIRTPAADVVAGFQPLMPSFELGDDEIAHLVAFIESLS